MMIRSQGSKRHAWQPLAALGVLVFVIVLGTSLAPYLRNIFASMFAPNTTDAAYQGLSHDALIARLKADDAELSRVGYQAALYGLLADENAKLRVLVNAPAAERGITARVLARPPRTLYDTLTIDQGTTAGVAVGNLAVFNGIALGKVASVSSRTAVVSLFSSPGTDTDALFGTPSAIAVLHGLGGGSFELSVPQNTAVAAGDSVRYQNSQSLLLGTVVAVQSKPSDALQTVSVRSPVSLSALDFIEILPTRS
jgi:cell shape-determining protein MreC